MSALTIVEYDDPTEHIFNQFLELLNDKGVLKSLVDANEVLFHNFDTADLKAKRGIGQFVLGGADNTGAVVGGKLDLTGADNSTATIANFAGLVAADFAYRFEVSIPFTSLGGEMDIYQLISKNDNAKIRVFMKPGAGITTEVRLQVVSAAGAVVSDQLLATETFAGGEVRDIAFSKKAGATTRFLYQGAIVNALPSSDGDYTNCDIKIGGTFSQFSIDNIQLFNSDFYPAGFTGYAVPFAEPYTYDRNENVLFTVIPYLLDEISAFNIVSTTPNNTQLKHFLVLNNVSYYYDTVTAKWVVSDQTLAQSNTLAEIQANFGSLPLVKGLGAFLQVGHVYKSDSGYATPEVESISISFSFQFKPSEVPLCVVYGTIKDNAGQPVVGATIRVSSDDKFINNALIGPSAKTVTDVQGNFSLSIPITELDNTNVNITVEYSEELFDPASNKTFNQAVVFKYDKRVIPDAPSAKLSDLAVAV